MEGSHPHSHARRSRPFGAGNTVARRTRMVMQTNWILDHLVYLHDATCSEIIWDCSSPDSRRIQMSVIPHADAGLDIWDGKRLQIILSNVVAVQFKGWGFVN